MSSLTYFAYGSNMLTERLRRRVPSTRPLGRGRLDGWGLRFHKRGRDGSAKCDIVESDEGVVYGVLFDIDAAERPLLDAAEGLGGGYELAEISVVTGRAKKEAFCYVASEDHIDASLKPFGWYRDFVLHGALEHELPPAYRRRIRQIEARADERSRRQEKNRRILASAGPITAELEMA